MTTQMNNKNLFAALASLVLVFAFASIVSANITFDPSTFSQEIDSGQTSITFDFDLVNDGAAQDNYTTLEWTLTSDVGTLALSAEPTESIRNENTTITATISSIPSDYIGTINANIYVEESGGSPSENLPITITVTDPLDNWEDNFCLYEEDEVIGNEGDLQVSVRNVGAVKTEGTLDLFGDSDEVLPFDSVEVEVRIENNNNDYDIDDIDLEWGLWNDVEKEWVIDVDDIENFDLKDGDEDEYTFTFTIDDSMELDLDELADGSDYVIYVRATGEVDDNNNTLTCDADTETLSIIIEEDFVIPVNVNIPSEVSCNDDFTISFDLWNIGEDDQDDVIVKVFSTQLGINEIFDFEEIEAFEYEKVEFTTSITEEVEEGRYLLTFEVYDKDGDVYENDYDDDLSSFQEGIQVLGSCAGGFEPSNILVSAQPETDGVAGEELVIRTSITNSGESDMDLILNIAGYREWASDALVDKTSLNLNAGETREVVLSFSVNEDALGEQSFNIEFISENRIVATQPVKIVIESKSSSSNFFADNLVWILVAGNIILILIIIIVAVKISSSSPKASDFEDE